MRVRPTSTVWAAVLAAASLAAGACQQASPLPGSPTAPDSTITAAQAAPDISGVWTYAEESRLVLPGELALAMGLAYEGPVLQMTCDSQTGVLTLTQTGSTFTGTLQHPVSTCTTSGGQAAPPPWPQPYEAILSGRLTGSALHIDQFDAPPAPPTPCPKNGTIEMEGGIIVQLNTTGRCDLSSAPFRPATATNRGTARRP